MTLAPQDNDRRTDSPPLQGRGRGWGLSANTIAELHERAADMRRNPTEPEKRVWRVLSGSQLAGHKFRRQAVLPPFIADFLCPSERLIVEVDGDTHDALKDRLRDDLLLTRGYRTVRVTNHDVMTNLEGVAHVITSALVETARRVASPHPNPSPEGEGLSIEVRDVAPADAAELADLLNAIIARGGTTALEDPYSPETLAHEYLTGPAVHCCFVAVDPRTGRIEGFQTLGRYASLPADIGDIGTFARVDGTQRGVGTALFATTRRRARQLGLTALNATIRADNTGGLAFYARQGFVDQDVARAVPLKSGTPVDRIMKRYALGADA